MPRDRLPRIMKHYSPIGRGNRGRPLKRFLDTWARNGSTSGLTPWQTYDDDTCRPLFEQLGILPCGIPHRCVRYYCIPTRIPSISVAENRKRSTGLNRTGFCGPMMSRCNYCIPTTTVARRGRDRTGFFEPMMSPSNFCIPITINSISLAKNTHLSRSRNRIALYG